jgi:DNA-binding NarL/FixJ family response regulator
MSAMNAPIRIVLADDHPVVRDGLVLMLETQPDFRVVGTADSGLGVLEQCATLQPDVLLLDLEMPHLDGLATLQRLGTTCPEVRVLVFTAFDTDDRIVAAIQAGAKGYLLKGVPRQEIFNAIRVVHGGGSLLQPIVASKLMAHLRRQEQTPALTAREAEVLQLMARGKPNKEIAADLTIAERTVKFHVSALLGKLGATNRTEAIARALQYGLVTLDTGG